MSAESAEERPRSKVSVLSTTAGALDRDSNAGSRARRPHEVGGDQPRPASMQVPNEAYLLCANDFSVHISYTHELIKFIIFFKKNHTYSFDTISYIFII
jgi:hypothetical protein